MARTLFKKELEYILSGATFLGAGGGGGGAMGLDLLHRLEQDGVKLEMELLELKEIADGEYGAMVAGLGSPLAWVDGNFGPDAVYAYKAFQKAMLSAGKKLTYLYSGEMGGVNTFVPMMVALLSDPDPARRIKFLDVCGNGRAVPELNTSLNSVRGYPPTPIGMGTVDGNEIVVYPVDDKAGEKIARTLCTAYNMQIGFSTWGMSKQEMLDNSVVGCVTKAQKVGEAIERAKLKGVSPFSQIKEVMDCKLFCTGEITDISVEVKAGFDVGVTTIRDQATGDLYTVDFQNENLLVRNQDGQALITVPDLTSVICVDQGENFALPLTNAETKVGMNIEVIVSPADPLWWAEDKKAYLCWVDALARAEYHGPQIKYKA